MGTHIICVPMFFDRPNFVHRIFRSLFLFFERELEISYRVVV